MSDARNRLNDLRIERADLDTGPAGGSYALAAITVLLVLGGVAGWWWYDRSRVPEVEVAVVEPAGDSMPAASTVLDASGYVTARRRATVSSKFTGKITEVLIEEGTRVDEGQVLARLDDSSATRQLALAEAQLASARSSLTETQVRLKEAELNRDRTSNLVASDVSSQAALDAAQAEVDSLVARLAVGREQIQVAERTVALRTQELDDTVIRAPFAGVVVTKNAQPGEMISPVSAGGGFTRTGIGTVVDMSSLEIEVDVNEAYINRVKEGQTVTAVLDAYQDWQIPATVITAVPTADRQKATVRVRIAFDELGDPRILPDMGVRVSFLGDDTEQTTTSQAQWQIPSDALRRDGDQDVVFVVRGDNVERRAVKVGPRQGDLAVVLAGVETGERVVTQGPNELADGDEVKVK